WFLLTTVGGSAAVKTAKFIAILLTVGFALQDNTILSIAAATAGGETIGRRQLTLGVAVLVTVLLVWVAVAFGITWVCFGSVKIKKELVFDGHYWRIQIMNCGCLDVEADVIMENPIN